MAGDVIYAFRVTRLPLLDAGGAQIGRIEDIVVVPGRPGKAPRVVGFVANSQRRRIFVNWARIGQLDGGGAQLRCCAARRRRRGVAHLDAAEMPA